MPFLTPVLGEGSPTKIDVLKNVGTLILTILSNLEDLVELLAVSQCFRFRSEMQFLE